MGYTMQPFTDQQRFVLAVGDAAERTEQALSVDGRAAAVRAELEPALEELQGRTEDAGLTRPKIAELEAELLAVRAGIGEMVAPIQTDLLAARGELAMRTEEARRAEARAAELQAELEATRDQFRETTAAIQAELLATREELAERTEEARREEVELARLRPELETLKAAPEHEGPEHWPVRRGPGGFEDQDGSARGSDSARGADVGSRDVAARSPVEELAILLAAAEGRSRRARSQSRDR